MTDEWLPPDGVIGFRESVFIQCGMEAKEHFLNERDRLVGVYGSWEQIPNKERTVLANILRSGRWVYHELTGWKLDIPNSVDLSSHTFD